MIAIQEIGYILRLIFVFRLNLKRINKAYKESENDENKKDFLIGLIFILAIILIGFLNYLNII